MRYLIALILGLSVHGQVSVSNTSSTGVVDDSGATHTLPIKKGLFSAIPPTCTVGEQYFATNVTAGQNLYGCTATNTWTLEAGGGSATVDATAIKNGNYFVTSGVGSAYTGSPTSAPSALATGQIYYVNFNTVSTSTTPTLSINSLTAQTMVHEDGTPLAVGELSTSGYCKAFYDGTHIQISGSCLTGPGTISILGSSGSATVRTLTAAGGTQSIPNVTGQFGIVPSVGVSNNCAKLQTDGTNFTVADFGIACGIANSLTSATTTIDVVSATAPIPGQVLTAVDSTHATWQTGGGAGITLSSGQGFFPLGYVSGLTVGGGGWQTTPRYQLFCTPGYIGFSQVAIRNIGSAGTTGKGFAVALYDFGGTKVSNSDGKITPPLAANSITIISLAGSVTLSSACYYMGYMAEETGTGVIIQAIDGGSAGYMQIVNGGGGLGEVSGTGTVTGTGSTLVMPTSIGTKAPQVDGIPLFYLSKP